MVCLGNICRSPMAEGLLKAKVDSSAIFVDSAGTSNYHIGQHPDERMIETARNHGIDISQLKGRQFTTQDFDNFDRIYAMDNSNYKNIVKLARNTADIEKVDLITNLLTAFKGQDVPDPYYGGQQGFENVYNLLDECTSQLSEELR